MAHCICADTVANSAASKARDQRMLIISFHKPVDDQLVSRRTIMVSRDKTSSRLRKHEYLVHKRNLPQASDADEASRSHVWTCRTSAIGHQRLHDIVVSGRGFGLAISTNSQFQAIDGA